MKNHELTRSLGLAWPVSLHILQLTINFKANKEEKIANFSSEVRINKQYRMKTFKGSL